MIPEKYSTVEELSKAWGVDVKTIIRFAADEKLELQVPVYCGPNFGAGAEKLEKHFRPNGYCPLNFWYIADALHSGDDSVPRKIEFEKGEPMLTLNHLSDDERQVMEAVPYRTKFIDLIVSDSERERFEKEGLKTPQKQVEQGGGGHWAEKRRAILEAALYTPVVTFSLTH